MKLKTLMIIKAVASMALAVVLLTIPGQLLTLAGVSSGLGALIYGRIYGAACVGIFLLTWTARNAEDSVARKAILLDACVYDAVGFLVLVVIQLSGSTNALVWVFSAVYLFFALSFGYYLMPQKKPAVYPS